MLISVTTVLHTLACRAQHLSSTPTYGPELQNTTHTRYAIKAQHAFYTLYKRLAHIYDLHLSTGLCDISHGYTCACLEPQACIAAALPLRFNVVKRILPGPVGGGTWVFVTRWECQCQYQYLYHFFNPGGSLLAQKQSETFRLSPRLVCPRLVCSCV